MTNESNLIIQAVVGAALQTGTVMVASRNGGKGHRVTVVGGQPVACTCAGFHFNQKCWALTGLRTLAANHG